MKRVIAVAVIAAAGMLAACAPIENRLQDGYQFGDGVGAALDSTEYLIGLQERYCTRADPVARVILLGAVRSVTPEYPSDGLCTDVVERLLSKAGEAGGAP